MFVPSASVNPNISLNCSGIWEGSPLCLERNEALLELRKLDLEFKLTESILDKNPILLDKVKHRIAKLDSGKKHNTGVYFTEVPHDPVNNLCTLDYDKAEQRGYFKIDCLNVSIYKDIKD